MIKKITIITFLIGALLLGFYLLGQPEAAKAQSISATPTYNLYATDGYVTLADGTRAYIYGFVGGRQDVPLTYLDRNGLPVTIATGSPAPTGGPITPAEAPLAGNAQFPAPVIYAAVGDTVTINLNNLGVTVASAPNDPHTIHLHGLDVAAANDGVPETSVAAVPANLKKTPGAGNVVVYMFSPIYPGTYMYHCHQEASIHVQMGMYGALVVYNSSDPAYLNGGPGKGFGGNLYGFEYDKDVILLLSEFDLGQHQAEEKGGPFNPVAYKPQYWFINGLSFPNTIHAGLGFNWPNWIAAHPNYDPFIIGSIANQSGAELGDQVLLRVINMGFETQPMHMHGFHGKIIGSDQRAWPWANNVGVWEQGLEKNTLTIGSGETYEWLVNFALQDVNANYPANSQTRYNPAVKGLDPVVNTSTGFPAIPDMFAPGFAYIGGPVVGPDGNQGGGLPPELPVVQGQFFPFHNHDDYKATNNGVYPGGMFTMFLTTP